MLNTSYNFSSNTVDQHKETTLLNETFFGTQVPATSVPPDSSRNSFIKTTRLQKLNYDQSDIRRPPAVDYTSSTSPLKPASVYSKKL